MQKGRSEKARAADGGEGRDTRALSHARSPNPCRPPQEIADLFRSLDVSGNGVISREDWRAGFGKYTAAASRVAKKTARGGGFGVEDLGQTNSPTVGPNFLRMVR